MGIFGLTFERNYPVQFGSDLMAMTADEILEMQLQQQRAMQQAYRSNSFDYLWGMTNYEPPRQPLDERFADFKVRLAAAIERHKQPLDSKTKSPPYGATS
jgi:hypothetical protein